VCVIYILYTTSLAIFCQKIVGDTTVCAATNRVTRDRAKRPRKNDGENRINFDAVLTRNADARHQGTIRPSVRSGPTTTDDIIGTRRCTFRLIVPPPVPDSSYGKISAGVVGGGGVPNSVVGFTTRRVFRARDFHIFESTPTRRLDETFRRSFRRFSALAVRREAGGTRRIINCGTTFELNTLRVDAPAIPVLLITRPVAKSISINAHRPYLRVSVVNSLWTSLRVACGTFSYTFVTIPVNAP